MELSKNTLKMYGKQVTVGSDAPISIKGRENWLIRHLGMTPEAAHDTVHVLMTKAIKDAAKAWWHEEIPDDMDLATWIDRRYDIILFDSMKGGDKS